MTTRRHHGSCERSERTFAGTRPLRAGRAKPALEGDAVITMRLATDKTEGTT